MKCVIMIGIPRSGKSTYVKSNCKDYQVICADDVRKALGFQFNQRIEPIVHAICEIEARAKMERGLDVVIDETNTSIKRVSKWTRLADEYGYKKIGIVLKTPQKVCMSRNVGEGVVPDEVIERMHDNFNILTSSGELQYVLDEVKIVETTGVKRDSIPLRSNKKARRNT